MLEYVLSALDDAVLAYNIDKQEYLFISPDIEKILGFPADNFKTIPNMLRDIIHPDDRAKILAELESIPIPGEKIMLFRILLPDKDVRWIQGKRVQLIHEDTGDRLGISILRNVTDAVLYKNNTEQKVWFLSSLINSVGALIYRIDVNSKFTYVNDMYAQKLGYTCEELIGENIEKVFHPEDRKALRGVIIQSIANPGKVTHFKHRKITAARNVRYFISSSVGVCDNAGNVTEIQGVSLDVTDQEKAEAEITWTKNNLEALINNTYDLIWSVDREKKYVFVNRAFETWIKHVYNLKPEQGMAASGTSTHAHAGDTAHNWDSYYDRALKGETFTVDYQEINPSTKENIYFVVAFNPIIDHRNRITGVGCFAHDVSQQVSNQQSLLDHNQRLKNIAMLSSHELRRPVATLMGLVDVLNNNERDNPENFTIIDHINTVAHELDNVIRLIVDKTYIE